MRRPIRMARMARRGVRAQWPPLPPLRWLPPSPILPLSPLSLLWLMLLLLSLLLPLSFLVACAEDGSPAQASGTEAGDGGAWTIRVTNPAGEELWRFAEGDMPASFAHAYSTINNWPAARFYAAEGCSVEDILRASGAYDTAQRITFRANDGYEVSLTREQLLCAQYFYPSVGENDGGAEPVRPIIAYRWREGSDDMGDIREDKPTLIIGQRNPFEHTNPAFVEGVAEIVVDGDACDAWAAATTFPLPGAIAAGETVKLQHPDYGLVKLFYTLDGSDPTMLSAMYNPSVYQPELNVPIPIEGPTVIKVIAVGYGKNDSEVAEFSFTVSTG